MSLYWFALCYLKTDGLSIFKATLDPFMFGDVWFIMKMRLLMSIGRKQKALIHIAKQDLHLDDEAYRLILKGVAGVESATQLTREGFDKVMARFHEMGFKGLLPHPSHPVPKGRLIPSDNPQGEEPITASQEYFIAYLLEKLSWEGDHYYAFCRRIIKKPDPLTKRDGQKIIIGLMAISRQRSRKRVSQRQSTGDELSP
jgi:hypothetical protein